MRLYRDMLVAVGIAAVALAALPAAATTVLKMDLDGLAARADRIFRATVLAAEPGTTSIGGAELPTTTYRLAVEETFKGVYAGKEGAVVEMTVLGSLKDAAAPAGAARFSALPQAPALVRGGDYVIFATAPSAAGLSTAVGLGQGAFKVYDGPDHQELAVNELGNLGLFDGPVTYTMLADAIRAAVGQ
jgi:hypothetical protein